MKQTSTDRQRLLQWFNAVQDLNPKYLEPEDFTLAERLMAPETQSPPEGGDCPVDRKEPRERCPSKQIDSATLRAALQQIADMDPKGIRADDLGRAARIASEAVIAYGVPEVPRG